MIRVEKDKQFDNNFRDHVAGILAAGAEDAAKRLKTRMSARYQKRTGYKYDWHPRVSSAEGEYPQQQSGSLRNSVGVETGDYVTEWRVGFFDEDMDKLKYLEFTGDPQLGGAGRRQPLYMFFELDGTRTLKFMQQAMSRQGRRG